MGSLLNLLCSLTAELIFENMLEPQPLCNSQKPALHPFKKVFFLKYRGFSSELSFENGRCVLLPRGYDSRFSASVRRWDSQAHHKPSYVCAVSSYPAAQVETKLCIKNLCKVWTRWSPELQHTIRYGVGFDLSPTVKSYILIL